jgi:hypothetical protein
VFLAQDSEVPDRLGGQAGLRQSHFKNLNYNSCHSPGVRIMVHRLSQDRLTARGKPKVVLAVGLRVRKKHITKK